ncbi:NRDE family protein [Agarilytica rhodophyticola]|uniref:NRDE family protein n=1 Tax=Agarilytica rhodophyticola TaxID=1737490 RepID=UPI000B34435E|nr:NRDE family protein [Agarilytica rhodophyticola]
MCTVSWLVADTGYHVFFNRDEQKTRAAAIPPKVIQDSDIRAVMPIDPVGQGTWCASNENGLTFALLNFYQGRWPKGRLISRGQIVRDCAACASIDEARELVSNLNLSKYAPFSLLLFSPEQEIDNGVAMLRWNGRQLEEILQKSPLISSSVRYDEVFAARMSVYRDMIGDGAEQTEDSFLAMHASHFPSKSALSMCMHREDAQTVSFSHIHVCADTVCYRYSDGPLCNTSLDKGLALVRA